ncbi:MAG TPA: hypothetical protein P5121_38985, partial [Caldilineaceae bacterium]|nr:hypothetical protein [Caldilineaceae bacterium]
NPPPAAGFDHPTGAIFAPKRKGSPLKFLVDNPINLCYSLDTNYTCSLPLPNHDFLIPHVEKTEIPESPARDAAGGG